MADFVRVRLDNGRNATLSRAYVDGLGDVETVDEPATNTWGRPLSATRADGRRRKPKTTVSKAAATKAAARKAASSAAASTTTTGGAAANSPEEGSE